MKLHHQFAALAAGLVLSASSQAAAVLYYADAFIGADAMGAALAAGGHTTSTATGDSDFTAKVGQGGWDLVIYMRQNNQGGSAAAALGNWVTGGNKAIFMDWTADAALAGLFGAAYTGQYNQMSMTITDAQLGAGLNNAVGLSNPGWGTFSMGLDATTGVSAAVFGNGNDAIVIGNGGRTILNGFLGDTLGANGQVLFANQLHLLLDEQTAAVPEPGSVALVGLALAALGLNRRRKPQA